MAINENIVTGRKFRKLVDEANKLWQRISFWSKASDVEFDDGSNAETKLGAINGVTDSLTSTASNIAASAAAVKALNDKITELNSNLTSKIRVNVDVGEGYGSTWARATWTFDVVVTGDTVTITPRSTPDVGHIDPANGQYISRASCWGSSASILP